MTPRLATLAVQAHELRARLAACTSSSVYARLAALRLEAAQENIHRGRVFDAGHHLTEAEAFIHYAGEADRIAALRLAC